MASFGSLAAFASHLGALVARTDHAVHESAEEGARIVATEARRVIGTYDYGWPQLAQSTQDQRLRAGFSPNEPLLRTGAMRASIQSTVYRGNVGPGSWEVEIGSNDQNAVRHELGTSSAPPRSFLMQAAVHTRGRLAHEMGERVVALLTHR